MSNRRQVIQAGMAAIMAPPAVLTHAAGSAARAGSGSILAIYDLQYPASVSFGDRAQQLGAAVRGIRSDITRVWREQLIALWRSGSAVQIGMTGYDAFFCLRMVARDWGMRAVYQMYHRPQSDGTFVHERVGHAIRPSPRYLHSQDWTRRDAELLLGRARWPFAAGDAEICHHAAAHCPALDPHSLVSWIFAPVATPVITATQISGSA